MAETKTRRRRTHSQRLKAEVLAACARPGASVAAIALAAGLNTNLVHKWRRQASGAAEPTVTRVVPKALPSAGGREFVELALPAAEPAIRVEICRGSTRVAVHWPLSAASACAAWLGSWLR